MNSCELVVAEQALVLSVVHGSPTRADHWRAAYGLALKFMYTSCSFEVVSKVGTLDFLRVFLQSVLVRTWELGRSP